MEIDFFGSSFLGRSKAIDPSRSINFFVEINANKNAKSRISMIGTPGTSLALTAGTGPMRGLYNFGQILYGISGNTLYRINQNLTATALGTLSTTVGQVAISDNGLFANGVGGNQMGIVDKQAGYVWNPVTSLFSVINSPGFPPNPSGLTFMDGYGIVTNGTMGLATSNLYDLTTWNPLTQAFAEATSDNIAGTENLMDQLIVIKEASAQAWYDSGTPTVQGSPFLPIPGAIGSYGTPYPDTICNTNEMILFIGSQTPGGSVSGVVGMSAYNSQQIISPPAITYRISQLPDISDAFSYRLDLESHVFYVTTFPSANWTLVYDISTKKWFEWSTWDESIAPDGYGRHLGSCYAFAYGKHFIGSYINGNIYELSSSFYTDAGQPIVSEWISDLYSDKVDLTNMNFHRLDIDAEVGSGDPTKPGPPVAELSFSNDAGFTYTKPYPCSMGFIGQYKTRLSWRRLGRGRNRVWKLRCSAPIRKIFTNAMMKVS